MAVRPYWKGYLTLSLVTCPVQMMPATSENEKVCFHTLNRETQNRVVSHYVDSVTGKEVREEDEVKGYQRGEDEYIILEICGLQPCRCRFSCNAHLRQKQV
jgi:DNA end-binding protein Ku